MNTPILAAAMPSSVTMNPSLLQTSFLILIWFLFSLTTVLVLLRLYARLTLGRHYGLDDLFIVIAQCFSLTCTVLWTVYALHGGCQSSSSLSYQQIAYIFKFTWISQTMSALACGFGEISVICFVLRMIDRTHSRTKLSLWAAAALTSALSTAFFVLVFAQCSPVKALWWPGIVRHSTCWNPRVVMVAGALTSSWMAFLNLALALLPITIILRLNVDRKSKIALVFTMSLGFVASICAAFKASWVLRQGDSLNGDTTWRNLSLLSWTSCEVNLIVFAACVPGFRSFLASLPPRRLTSIFGGQSRRQSHADEGEPAIAMIDWESTDIYASPLSDVSRERLPPEGHIVVTTVVDRESQVLSELLRPQTPTMEMLPILEENGQRAI